MSKIINKIFSIAFLLFLITNYFLFIKGDILNIKQAFYEIPVYNEEMEFKEFYLEFNNMVNSKNFMQVFSKFQDLEYEIRKIYPIVYSNYNEELTKNLSEYSFDSIDNFTNYYISNLQKYNLDEDINNVNVYGIKIDKILIYTTETNIKEISKETNFTYKNKKA